MTRRRDYLSLAASCGCFAAATVFYLFGDNRMAVWAAAVGAAAALAAALGEEV